MGDLPAGLVFGARIAGRVLHDHPLAQLMFSIHASDKRNMDAIARIKSVIVTQAPAFRTGATKLLNAAGFAAAKVTLEDSAALTEALADPLIGNILVDAVGVSTPDLKKLCELIKTLTFSSPALTIVAVAPERLPEISELAADCPMVNFRAAPLRIVDLIEVLVTPRQAISKAVIAEAPRRVTQPVAGPASRGKEPANPSNATLNDTLEHLRVTVEKLKMLAAGKVAEDHHVLMGNISQRFNGIYGAFLFLVNREGYKQFGRLCEIVDDIGRTAAAAGKEPVVRAHLQLMLEAARCAFAILKVLRVTQPLTPAQIAECAGIEARYLALDGILKRQLIKQNDVDDLIDSLKKTGS